MATIKYKGVRIVPVKVTKYEVRDPTGHVMHRAGTHSAAKQWVNGYFTASAQALKEAVAVATTKPKRIRKPKQPLQASAE